MVSIDAKQSNIIALSHLYIKRNELLTLEETLELRAMYGFGKAASVVSALKKMYKELDERGITTPAQFWLFYESRLMEEIEGREKEGRRSRNLVLVYIDSLLLHMIYSRIEFNRAFINKFASYRLDMLGRGKALNNYYKLKKLKHFPELDAIQFVEHKRFLISLVAFYRPQELSQENIILELLNAYSGNKYMETGEFKGALNLREFLLEFISGIYPALLEHKLVEKMENVYEFLYDKYMQAKSDVQILRDYLKNKTEGIENTEFFTVLNKYIESKIEDGKLTLSINKLRNDIYVWTLLSKYSLDEGCETIKDISHYHRDLVLEDYIGKNMKHILTHIRSIIHFYNQKYFDKDFKNYYDVTIFASKWARLFGRNAKHYPLEGAALGNVIYSLAREIKTTRETSFEKKSVVEKNRFFIARILWCGLLLGRRMFELRHLKLNRVQSSLKATDGYIHITTVKDNDDGVHVLERGEQFEDGTYEFDYLHYDIFEELFKAAKIVYENSEIPTKAQYLFPSCKTLKDFSVNTVRNHFNTLQKRSDIVHGSPVTFKNKQFYDSSPELEKLKGKPLFTPHSLRHININLMHVYGRLPLASVIDLVGHRSEESIGNYTRTMLTVFQVFKLLEQNGHIGAANKLVSRYYEKVPKEIDSTLKISLEDFLDFLNEFNLELGNLVTIKSKSSGTSEFTELDSECVTDTSCADTGMTCLGCEDFRAGKMTVEALENVRTMFGKEYQQIDIIIEQINMRKKDILRNGHKKEVYIKMFYSLIDRFQRCSDAKERTLMSEKTGWSLTKGEANKLLHPIILKTRKRDLDKDIVKYINECRKKQLFDDDLDFTLYRSAKHNKAVFR